MDHEKKNNIQEKTSGIHEQKQTRQKEKKGKMYVAAGHRIVSGRSRVDILISYHVFCV